MIISLNSNESKIFQLLRDCVKETGLPVTLRVAGGWVRDKVKKNNQFLIETYDFIINL